MGLVGFDRKITSKHVCFIDQSGRDHPFCFRVANLTCKKHYETHATRERKPGTGPGGQPIGVLENPPGDLGRCLGNLLLQGSDYPLLERCFFYVGNVLFCEGLLF